MHLANWADAFATVLPIAATNALAAHSLASVW